jgi:hypothetical protein
VRRFPSGGSKLVTRAKAELCEASSTNSQPLWLLDGDAGWSSPVARQAHNLKVVGSNPTPATTEKPAKRIFWYNASVARSGLSCVAKNLIAEGFLAMNLAELRQFPGKDLTASSTFNTKPTYRDHRQNA